jgi:hypothetical protein
MERMSAFSRIITFILLFTSLARGAFALERGLVADTTSWEIPVLTGNGTLGGTGIAPIAHKPKKPHSPRKATLMAMGLPGLGQIYNGHWWKLPILYGGAGAALYGLDWNQRNYKKYRDAFVAYTRYIDAKAADPDLPYPRPNEWDKLFKPGGTAENINPQRFQDILKTNKNDLKRDRDLLLIVMGGIYVIQILDATVFAHFYEYEISEDLSMSVTPTVGHDSRAGSTLGLSLTLKF